MLDDPERRFRQAWDDQIDASEPTMLEQDSWALFWFVIAVLVIGAKSKLAW